MPLAEVSVDIWCCLLKFAGVQLTFVVVPQLWLGRLPSFFLLVIWPLRFVCWRRDADVGG